MNVQTVRYNQEERVEASRFRIVLGILIILLFSIWATRYGAALLNDSDTWWHIKTGADIWRSRTFPAYDTYSYTFYGQPWIAKEWLSQVILHLSYEAAGWNGVAATAAAAICLMAAALYFILSRHLRPIVAAIVTILAMFLASPTFLARPHTFTFVLMVIWTYRLFTSARELRGPPFGLLAVLILWANLHAGFTLGFAIAFFAFLDYLELSRLRDRPGIARWILFLVLCPLVTLLHPYTYQAILATLSVAGPNEAVPMLTEWQPFNAQDRVFHEIALLLLAFALLVSGLRVSFAKAAFLVFMLHMFLAHIRFAYVFFPLLPLVIAADIEKQFPSLSAATWTAQSRDPLERFLAAIFRPFAVAASLAIGVVFFVLLRVLTVAPGEDKAATAAITYAKEHKLSGHVLNWYNFGGPLIFHGIPTYLDGRTDQLFLGGFTANDVKMRQPGGKKLLLDALKRYDVQWTLLRPDDPRILILGELKDWKRAYADEFAVIHVPVSDPP